MENKQCGAYILTHVDTGIFYVGSTGDFVSRKGDHYHLLRHDKHHSRILQQVYNDNQNISFQFFPTETREDAYDLEQKLLDDNSRNNRMSNIAINSRLATKGLYMSPEQKAKISTAGLGRKHTEETKQKISEAHIGICTDANREHLRQLAESQSGVPLSAEHRANISAGGLGRKFSPEHKDNIALALKGKKKSPTAIANNAKARLGFKQSPEAIEKIKLASTGRFVSQATRDKIAENNRKRVLSRNK